MGLILKAVTYHPKLYLWLVVVRVLSWLCFLLITNSTDLLILHRIHRLPLFWVHVQQFGRIETVFGDSPCTPFGMLTSWMFDNKKFNLVIRWILWCDETISISQDRDVWCTQENLNLCLWSAFCLGYCTQQNCQCAVQIILKYYIVCSDLLMSSSWHCEPTQNSKLTCKHCYLPDHFSLNLSQHQLHVTRYKFLCEF